MNDFKSEFDKIKNLITQKAKDERSNDTQICKEDSNALLSSKLDVVEAAVSSLSEDLKNLSTKIEFSCNLTKETSLETSFDKANVHDVSLFDEIAKVTSMAEKGDENTLSPSDSIIVEKASNSGPKPARIVPPSKKMCGVPRKKDRNVRIDLIETDDDFQLVTNKKHKKGLSKRVHFDKQVDQNEARPALTKNKTINKSNHELIYVTNTPTYMNEGEMSRYISKILKIKDHTCHLVVPFNKMRSELQYLNFKVRVLSSDAPLLMRKDSWPHGVVPRKWKTGYERSNGFNSPPFRPNFRHH